jgi:hypothetical protein
LNISHLIILWNGKYFVHLQQNIETITILKIIQFPKVCCAVAACLLFLLGGQRAGAYNDHRVGKIDSIENHLLSNRQKMTDDEIMAIRWHMGAWQIALHNEEMQQDYIHATHNCPLLSIIEAADKLAAQILEVTK